MKRVRQGYVVKLSGQYVYAVIEPSSGHASPTPMLTSDISVARLYPSKKSCSGIMDYFRGKLYKVKFTTDIQEVK